MKYSRRVGLVDSMLIQSNGQKFQKLAGPVILVERCKSEMTTGEIPDYHLFDEISTNL